MSFKTWQRGWNTGATIAALVTALAVSGARLAAAPINPIVFKQQFEEKKKDAEVVAQVRVLAVVCTHATGDSPENRAVTLQLSLQALAVEKGAVKKNDVIVVSHTVKLPAGPGPRAYGYMAAVRQFPFTPGVQGDVALRWDKENRRYNVVAGWVPEPNQTAIPTEVGKAAVASEPGADK